jgi:hypothetical protein
MHSSAILIAQGICPGTLQMCSVPLVAVQLSCVHEAQLSQQVYCTMQYTAGMAAQTYVIIYSPLADAVPMTSMPVVPVDIWHWLRDGTGSSQQACWRLATSVDCCTAALEGAAALGRPRRAGRPRAHRSEDDAH